MSNLPPGVTGNEPQIAGPSYENDEDRKCDAEMLTISVFTGDARAYLKYARDLLALHPDVLEGQHLAGVRSYLSGMENAIDDVGVSHCPFEGTVTVLGDGGTKWWDCPLCETRHEEDEEGPDV